MRPWIIALCAGGFAIFVLFILFGWGVSISNAEVQQANLVHAKQVANKNSLDAMNKSINQAAQVTDAQRQALIDIIVGNSTARAEQGKGSLAASITEAVPNLDTASKGFNDLMNIVIAARAGWKRDQDELIDLNRVHDNQLQMFPSSLICGFLGRQKIDITIVTSTRTEAAFATGKDDDTSLGLHHGDGTGVEKH